MKLKTDGIGLEAPAGQPRPPDRVLAFSDPLLRRAAPVVERNDPFGGTGQVGDDEADPRIQLPRMPFDLGHNTPGLAPACGPVAEAGEVPSDFMRGAAPRTAQQVANAVLKHLVPRQSDRVTETFSLQILVDLR